MHYRILVLTRQSLGEIDGENLRHNLLDVNFETLCDQYQLDQTQIEPVKSNLEVIVSKDRTLPYFLVKYGANQDRPIIVYEWDLETEKGKRILAGALGGEVIKKKHEYHLEAKHIIEIELAPNQIKDMGMLLAYEFARWAAAKEEGVVLGLDGIWYRLNRHQAFVPIISLDS